MIKSKIFSEAISAIKRNRFYEASLLLHKIKIEANEVNAKKLMTRILDRINSIVLNQGEALTYGYTVNFSKRHLPENLTLPSGKKLPKISIVTPSYNQGSFIEETIRSVQAQGYPNVEHILIDGGSTDETMTIVDKYQSHFSVVISEKDRGQSDAINKGFSKATGDIFCWLNSDDQLAPNALFSVALAFDLNEPDLVAGICEVYRDGKLEHRHLTSCRDGKLPLNDLLDLDNCWNSGQFFYQPEVFFSREIWERVGGYVRDDLFYSMDYELWCRFAHFGGKLKVIGTPLAWFRSHPAQKTAVEERFKSELVKVRDWFITENNLSVHPRESVSIDWARRPRIALLNDHGPLYGAGIAHARIGAALEIGECTVELFEASRFTDQNQCDVDSLINEIYAYDPDLVIFGNMHSIGPSAVDAVVAACERFPSAWVTHDFWLFTGRCAYFGTCKKYLSECDANCPTADEYPPLPSEQIASLHMVKRQLLKSNHSPVIWANSSWAGQVANQTLSTLRRNERVEYSTIRLGVAQASFGRRTRVDAREQLGIPLTDFVVLFSASSLSDQRKGFGILLAALQQIKQPRMRLLILGNSDVKMNSFDHDILALGYVNDAALIAAAFAAADLFIGPSQEETFGQVFVEAALSGTPSISFDLSGMVDAVNHGTSGLRVPNDAGALAHAIVQVANDSEMREKLGFWASVWARSSHSLEASYRSMHHALEDLGLPQRLALPRRITLMDQSRLGLESNAPVRSWLAADGVSPPEGPYPPEFPGIIQWCSGPLSIFRLRLPCTGRVRVQIEYINPLFNDQEVVLELNDVLVARHTLGRTAPQEEAFLEFDATAQAGWCLMALRTSRYKAPDTNDSRSLALIIRDIRVMSLESEPNAELAQTS